MSASAPPRPQIPRLDELSLVIETPRLVIRPIAASDTDALHPIAADPAVSRLLSWSAHADREQTRAWIQSVIEARAAGTAITWAIERDGQVIGCIGLSGITWTFRAWRIDRAELGYWLGQGHWGQGLMSEAALAATRWGFETLGLHKITIGCMEGNAASQKIIERIGYRFLAIHEDDAWRDGRWWNHRRYEMTAADWADTTRTLRFRRPV